MQLEISNVREEIENSSLPVLVDFYADWCGPCKKMTPIIEELTEDWKGECSVLKVSIEKEPTISSDYGVKSLPTFMIFVGGDKVQTITGSVSKEKLDNAIREAIASR